MLKLSFGASRCARGCPTTLGSGRATKRRFQHGPLTTIQRILKRLGSTSDCMYSSITIANYFLRRGWDEQIGISPQKLLKLVYVTHGWYLGALGEPLIRDRIMAWRYGPIIPALYHQVKGYGGYSITAEIRSAFYSANEDELDEIVRSFLDKIWERYRDFTGIELSSLTHQKGTPWDVVRARSPRAVRRSRTVIIRDKVIEDYYRQRVDAAAEQPVSSSKPATPRTCCA